MKKNIESQELTPRAARIRRGSRGFTLVELMAVIVVIGIVAGGLIAGIVYLHERALRTRTKATLQQVCTAIEMFKADRNGYPPDFTCTTDGGVLQTSQYVWPCEALWFWLGYWGPHQQHPKQPYIDFKGDQTVTGNTRILTKSGSSTDCYKRIIDAWGNPLNYKSVDGNSYRFTDGSLAPRHCPQSCDLCSYGADGTTWKELGKPFDRQQELSLDRMVTVIHGNGQDRGEIPEYFFKPFDTQVSTRGGMKHCFGGEDNNDINNWREQ